MNTFFPKAFDSIHSTPWARRGAYGIGGAALLVALSAIAGFGLHQAGVSPFDTCRYLDWKALTGGLLLLGVTVGGTLVWRRLLNQEDVKKKTSEVPAPKEKILWSPIRIRCARVGRGLALAIPVGLIALGVLHHFQVGGFELYPSTIGDWALVATGVALFSVALVYRDAQRKRREQDYEDVMNMR